jgi:hypothetical protein
MKKAVLIAKKALIVETGCIDANYDETLQDCQICDMQQTCKAITDIETLLEEKKPDDYVDFRCIDVAGAILRKCLPIYDVGMLIEIENMILDKVRPYITKRCAECKEIKNVQ